MKARRVKEAGSLDHRADGKLGRLITKRHDPRDGDALLEPTYAESVHRYNARQQQENRSKWGNFHEKMARDRYYAGSWIWTSENPSSRHLGEKTFSEDAPRA